jgi:chromosomal replication initiation ATPase DnaA
MAIGDRWRKWDASPARRGYTSFRDAPLPKKREVARLCWMTIQEAARERIALVAAVHGVEIPVMLGNSRQRKVVAARWGAIRFVHELGLSTPQIGKLFNRDHTSILHALGRRGRQS